MLVITYCKVDSFDMLQGLLFVNMFKDLLVITCLRFDSSDVLQGLLGVDMLQDLIVITCCKVWYFWHVGMFASYIML